MRRPQRTFLGVAIVAATVAATLPACDRARPAVSLAPVVRVLEILQPSRSTALVQGADVTLDREAQRTVALATSTAAMLTLDDTQTPPVYRLRFLSDLGTRWSHIRVRRIARVHGVDTTLPPVRVPIETGHATIAVVPGESPVAEMAAAVQAALPRHTTTVESRPFVVPAGAELRFAVGDYAGAGAAGPVGARVSVVDGRAARTVWRDVSPGSSARWRPQRVGLAPFVGRSVRLRFTSRVAPDADDSGMLAVFGEPVVLAPRLAPTRPFNVVLVSMDTLRARSLGAYGCARATSPTLDALGAAGARFDDAFSTAAFTLPGHMSMFTGLWFRTHRAIVVTSKLDPQYRTLAEALQSAGYATGAFTSGAWIMPWTGFRRGFDTYFEQASDATGATRHGGGPYEAFTRALEWMAMHTDQPHFAFLHNYVVHMPYRAPRPYDTMFDPVSPDARGDAQQVLAYEREVRYADDQVRALLERLESLGLADRTLVVVTADHGEQFGEHGGHEHTYDVHESVAHVPLLMRLPGAIRAGTVITEPVSIADIVPTVLDILGLPPLDGVDGQSLWPLLAGTQDTLLRPGVFSEATSDPHIDAVDLVGLRTRTHTCIHYGRIDRWDCYDRQRDPWEGTPLADDDTTPALLDARSVLTRFAAAQPAPGATPPAPDPAEGSPPDPAVTQDRQNQLRALGYLE